MRSIFLRPSVLALAGANLLPIYGLSFLGWRTFEVLVLFWLENVVIGVFNVARMVAVRPRDAEGWVSKVFVVPFFVIHYGLFTMIHGIFVVAIFDGGEDVPAAAGPSLGAILEIVNRYQLWWGAVALGVSHGVSFVWNYLRAGEYQRLTIVQLMKQPYERVVVLHITVIAGAFMVTALKAEVGGLIVLIVLKVFMDVRAHLREHRKLGGIGEGSIPNSSHRERFGAAT